MEGGRKKETAGEMKGRKWRRRWEREGLEQGKGEKAWKSEEEGGKRNKKKEKDNTE